MDEERIFENQLHLTMRSNMDQTIGVYQQSTGNRDQQLQIRQRSDGQIERAICIIEEALRLQHPFAKEFFIENRKGERISVGVYDAPLVLNEKRQYKQNLQPSPQLLGTEFAVKATEGYRGELFARYSAWLSAFHKVLASDNDLWLRCQPKIDIYPASRVQREGGN